MTTKELKTKIRCHEHHARGQAKLLRQCQQALDALALALTNHNHKWTAAERKLYERATTTANDPSSATRPTRRADCNQSAMAGFAAAHG